MNTTPLDKAKILGPRNVLTPTAATINNPLVDQRCLITASSPPPRPGSTPSPRCSRRWRTSSTTTRRRRSPMDYDPDGNVLDPRGRERHRDVHALRRARPRDRRPRLPLRPGRLARRRPASSRRRRPATHRTPARRSRRSSARRSRTTSTTASPGSCAAPTTTSPSPTADDSIITNAYDSLSRTIEETQQIGALGGEGDLIFLARGEPALGADLPESGASAGSSTTRTTAWTG